MKKFINYHILSILFVLCCGVFTSCGDDNDDEPVGVEGTLIGKWGYSGELDGDFVTSEITFGKDGKATIKETFRDYPEDNYTVTVNYSVEGDVSKGAVLEMWGKDVEGYDTEMSWMATLSGDTLILVGIGGEATGDKLVMKRK